MDISLGAADEILAATAQQRTDGLRSFRAVLSSDLLDQNGAHIDALLNFAFDTLGAQRIDVRIVPSEGSMAQRA